MERVNVSSKILLDGADPRESRKARALLGFLDGQTTNPTLLARNPEILKKVGESGKFSEKELYSFYRKIIKEMAKIASGPVSIEVYADKDTKAEEMLVQAREMKEWIPQSCIKLPIVKEGLRAAEMAVQEGISLNMTLCFSQEQAAAVYAATRGAKAPVYVSPFIGRLDDRGENGPDLVKNIVKMYRGGDGHVSCLAASLRNLNHLLCCLQISSPLITAPLNIIEEWAENNFSLADCQPSALKPIPYRDISLDRNWQDYDIYHSLTEAGIEKFCADWKAVIK